MSDDRGAAATSGPSAPEPEPEAAWQRALPVAAMAAVAFVAALVVHHWLYRYGSGDRDEAVYQYQAELLRDGLLSVPVDQFRFYRPWLTDLYRGRLVVPFTLPWAAVLALSSVLFGSPVVALGMMAAALTVATFLFTHALLGHRRTALLATALVSFSPFIVSQSGTYLNYVLALTLELLAGWTLLRGVGSLGVHPGPNPSHRRRPRASGWLVASGVLWASAVWCRPLDGILVGLPFAAWMLYRLRSEKPTDGANGVLRRFGPPVGWLAAGAAPVAAGILVANRLATGSALLFPVTAQSDGAARMGWGRRGIFRDELTINFTIDKAVSSLGDNISALPTWLVGSYLAVALAAYGAWCLRRQDRVATVLLVAIALVCPIGYLGWFASALTVPGAYDGIGPHYYLPSVVPLAVLGAVGARDLWGRRPPLAAAGVALAALVTVVSVVPKVQNRMQETAYDQRVVRTVDRAVATSGARPALVVMPATRGADGIMQFQDHFANRPDLSGPVVYALDRGPGLFDLLDQHPDRVPFRVTKELRPGGGIDTPDPVIQPIVVVSGAVIDVRTTITSTSDAPIMAATIEQDGQVVTVELDDRAVIGRRYVVSWQLQADGEVEVVVDGTTRRVDLQLDRSGEVGIGVAVGEDPALLDAARPGRSVHTFPYRRSAGARTIEASTATAETVDFGGRKRSVLPVDISDQISVALAAP